MKLNKILLLGSLSIGFMSTSCIGDLDLSPIDPNLYTDTTSEAFYQEALGECYSILAVSGQDGPGSSIISGLDNGTGNYTRAIFMMNEFTTDEAMWIWKDAGVYDLITCTFDASNANIEGTYARLYAHIAVCNQFINSIPENASEQLIQMQDEARALRAMSYYWVLDIFGNGTFTLNSPDNQTAPGQTTRQELYNWLESELVYLADNSKLPATPLYGRVGKDGAEALLARLYLNAGVYTGTGQWDKCAERCQNIISRHKGGGFYGSGLANNYLSLFCADNNQYMPGGGNSAENEILWGVPFDSEHVQSYGGTTFLIASQVNGSYETGRAIGLGAEWGCLKAIEQLTNRFLDDELEDPSSDVRFNHWIVGTQKFGDEEVDFTVENAKFGDWLSGATVIKWTNLGMVNGDVDWDRTLNYSYPTFADADFALIRLADIYLMYAECYLNDAKVNGQAITGTEAANYVNYVRQRAGQGQITVSQLTKDFILNERSRELYWELTRRSDLIRFGKFAGNGQEIWAWKGDVVEGTGISERYNLMPIPTNIMAAQPYFKQNPGW